MTLTLALTRFYSEIFSAPDLVLVLDLLPGDEAFRAASVFGSVLISVLVSVLDSVPDSVPDTDSDPLWIVDPTPPPPEPDPGQLWVPDLVVSDAGLPGF